MAAMKSLHDKKDPQKLPLVIGWKERLDFPEWGLCRLKVKIDTGARTSALDVVDYKLRRTVDRGLIAQLQVTMGKGGTQLSSVVEAPVLQMLVVRNSFGVEEERPLIETLIRLGPLTKRVPLTVTNRSGMLFRMILGRTALGTDFLVDVSRKYLLKRRPV